MATCLVSLVLGKAKEQKERKYFGLKQPSQKVVVAVKMAKLLLSSLMLGLVLLTVSEAGKVLPISVWTLLQLPPVEHGNVRANLER